MRIAKVEDLIGGTLENLEQYEKKYLLFTTIDNKRYLLMHIQDCCESVYIEDINGNLSDLIGSTILMSEEISSKEHPDDIAKELEGIEEELGQSFTWTFYKFATIKGYVTVRFYGTSNGYYSQTAKFMEISEDELKDIKNDPYAGLYEE